MRKSCCIDDADISPRKPSCSMILRSDCSHGPSRISPLVLKEQHEVNSQKKKHIECLTREKLYDLDSSESSSVVESYLKSSLKEFASRTVKTCSILKENLCNPLDFSGSQSNKLINGKATLSRSEKELFRLTLSAENLINNNSISQECVNINNNFLTQTSSEMSRSHSYARHKSAANALSESESDDCSLQDNMRKRRSSRFQSTGKSDLLESNNNTNHVSLRSSSTHQASNTFEIPQREHTPSHNVKYTTPMSSFVNKSELNHTSGSNASFSSGSPSLIDISTVQYTPVDRFRWFLWRNIYLQIIKCVNFDVWLLSRIQNHRRLIALLLLLPFLVYLLYGGLTKESRSNNLGGFSSNVISFSSYVYSHISSPFLYNKDIESCEKTNSCSRKFTEILHTIYLAILNFFSNIFGKISESTSFNNKPVDAVIQSKSTASQEDLKLFVVQILEEKLADVVNKIQVSQKAQNIQSEKEDNANKKQSEIMNLRLEFQSLIESVQKFEKDVTQKSEGSSLKIGNIMEDYNTHIASINEKMKQFEEKLASLSGTVKKCCDEKWTISDFTASFEKHFLSVLKQIVDGGKDKNAPYYFFIEWLHSKLAHDKESLSQELKLEFEKLNSAGMKFDDRSQAVVENVVRKYTESLRKNITTFTNVEASSSEQYSLDMIRQLIKEAILLYDADKTGLVDYALESGGGSVLSTRCSESYAEKDGTISVLGFSLWSTHNSPRTAIQPDMQPGQCWAFKGSQGFLVIQLAYTIYPTGFTLEHIPVSLSPSGSIDSAPKDFSVWGLVSEKDNEGILLGKYSYVNDGDPLQYFPAQNTYIQPFSFVELKIHSNHGNLDYTCLYRFRVHGNRPKH